jgi:hypothetical protein
LLPAILPPPSPQAFWHRGKKVGNTLCSDGWDSVQKRPLLNILASNPKGVVFMDAIDTSGEAKTGQYIADQMFTAIEQVVGWEAGGASESAAAACGPATSGSAAAASGQPLPLLGQKPLLGQPLQQLLLHMPQPLPWRPLLQPAAC